MVTIFNFIYLGIKILKKLKMFYKQSPAKEYADMYVM